MKLTAKLEAEIHKAYNEYWYAYLKGDIRTMSYWMHEHVQMIGSGRGEFFENKKETIKYYKSTADQVAGKADMRNRKINVMPVGDQILVNEECDFFVLIDSVWTFYGEGRISTLFTKTNKGWKIIQEHGSMPDARTSGGEQVNTNKIKAENIRLKDAVKRRTVELENKNRELEIESALERVRTVAMGIKKPEDMLTICKTISKQLASLGIKEIRNIQTAIFYEQRGTYMNYQYYAKHYKTFITDTVYTDHKVARDFAAQMLKGKGKFYITHIKGKKVKDWIAYQKKTNVFIDKYLYTAPSLSYYWYSLGPVALGISTYFPLTEEEENLFKRFLKVFELSYRRYLDIEKAATQAREARIEMALERVRAIAMAMRKPEDLSGIGETLFTELKKTLGFADLRNTEIIIVNDAKETLTSYYYSDYGVTGVVETNYNSNPKVHDWVNQLKKTNDAFAEVVVTQKEIKAWRKYREEVGHIPDPKLNKAKEVYYYSYSIGLGGLSISTFKPVSKQQIKILERFRNVFNLSYQRYIDIAKAEAQAKESKIELGLERVRARAMAMQNSDELAELVATVFKELTQLDFTLTSCIIWIHDHSKDTLWIASSEMNKPAKPYQIKPFHNDFFRSIVPAWKAKDTTWVFTLTGIKKKNFEKAFFKELPNLPNALEKALKVPKQVVFSASFNNFGALEIVETEALTEEKFNILHRFGKVFDASYTRFNDLKKAEAQAREAKIEAALV